MAKKIGCVYPRIVKRNVKEHLAEDKLDDDRKYTGNLLRWWGKSQSERFGNAPKPGRGPKNSKKDQILCLYILGLWTSVFNIPFSLFHTTIKFELTYTEDLYCHLASNVPKF